MTTEINSAADHSLTSSAGSASTLPTGTPGAATSALPRPVSFAWAIVRFIANCFAWVQVRIDAIVFAVAAFIGPVEFEVLNTCPECERVCGNVIEGAYRCTGPVRTADCTVCVERVRLNWADRCPNGAGHTLANIRPKNPTLGN